MAEHPISDLTVAERLKLVEEFIEKFNKYSADFEEIKNMASKLLPNMEWIADIRDASTAAATNDA